MKKPKVHDKLSETRYDSREEIEETETRFAHRLHRLHRKEAMDEEDATRLGDQEDDLDGSISLPK